MTPEIHDFGSDVETRLSEVARSNGRTMEAEAAGILTAIHDRLQHRLMQKKAAAC